jgi:acetyltransferase-like isoleucine patch superfamily enzyme
MNKVLLRRISNRALHLMARFLPGSTNVRPFLHRLRGVKIHGNIFIGDDVYLENEHPESVEIHDGVAILLRSTIIAHMTYSSTPIPGKIIIEKGAFIGTGCTIVCSAGQSLTIGEGSVISTGAVVQNNVPSHTLCAGPRIKAIAKVTVSPQCATSHQDFIRGLRPLGASNKASD